MVSTSRMQTINLIEQETIGTPSIVVNECCRSLKIYVRLKSQEPAAERPNVYSQLLKLIIALRRSAIPNESEYCAPDGAAAQAEIASINIWSLRDHRADIASLKCSAGTGKTI